MKLNLRNRLLLSFGAVLVLTLLMAGWAVLQLRSLRANTSQLAENWLPSVRTLAELDNALYGVRLGYVRLALSTDPKERKLADEAISKNAEVYESAWKRYTTLVSSPEERKLADEVADAHKIYAADGVEMHRLIAAGQEDKVVAMNTGSMKQHGRDVAAKVSKVMKINMDGATAEAAAAEETYQRALVSTLVAAAVAVLVGLVLAWRNASNLSRRVGLAATAATHFADGDLAHTVSVEGHDEVAEMQAALARMQEQFSRIVTEVRQNAESVATASSEISQGNSDLSSRTEQQASALQQTAASMEQINGTARHNADNAAQASQLADQASGVADSGSAVVGEVVNTMHEIEKASREMEDIIAVIDGIAFQTNILALNAAVEAARAGEQGRGFAVVASEVRALAGRSAEAAKQVKTLIQKSVEQVSTGSELADKAGRTMQEVKTSVQRVSDIVGEIASGSREQMGGVNQISEAVSHMDQTTQQNAALVEQSAAAAESLRQQADTLVKAVAVFRTSGAGDRVVATASVRTQTSVFRPAAASPAKAAAAPRPANVARPDFSRRAAKPAASAQPALATGTEGDWTSF
ncbi:MAG: methyl-accepting chemotaxis protein [Roseateles depolymerans]|uniref:Methyl-accepting chemotaxis protein n=1 Tax=Roseateles depolymerans TaxID=76731 RepID=A0A2W5DR62_9BURK|nr:MAG: methyl-accepting chemotaxis protein [Roseateles depolymerans]